MSTDNGIQDLLKRLDLDLENERKANKTLDVVAGIFVLIVACYLLWLSVQLGRILQPDAMAEAAAGAALDAAPSVTAHVRGLVVDGAPDLARTASDAAIEMVPAYRAALEDEMKPVIDEVSMVIATTALQKMSDAGPGGEVDESLAMQEAADAVIARLDTVLAEAMDEPIEQDGQTPRELIDGSLENLEMVDRGLKRMASGGGESSERELVMAWLNVLQQYGENVDADAAEVYRTTGKTADQAPPQ